MIPMTISREALLRHFYPVPLFEDCSTKSPEQNKRAYRANVERRGILLDAISTWFIAFSYLLYGMQTLERCQCVKPDMLWAAMFGLAGVASTVFLIFIVVYGAAYMYLSMVEPD